MTTIHFKAPKELQEILREVMQETMIDLNKEIYKETGGKCILKEVIYQDETIVQGIFKTSNSREGTFSFCKSLVPALVVVAY